MLVLELCLLNDILSWKIKKFGSKYNFLEAFDWSVLDMMDLDTLELTWLQLPASWPLAGERLNIDPSVKPASC